MPPGNNENNEPEVDYLGADFAGIKQNLINHIKQYYPKRYKDFNSTSFGMLMVDLVAYVGDMLSFYIDFAYRESSLSESVTYSAVTSNARDVNDYEQSENRTSTGEVDFYIPCPAETYKDAPDYRYIPRILQDTKVGTSAGVIFTVKSDVDPLVSNINATVNTATADGSGAAYYIVKAAAEVISGQTGLFTVYVGNPTRFLKIKIEDINVTSIVSIYDSSGHEYVEVNHLPQNRDFVAIPNIGDRSGQVPSIIKEVSVPRRFCSVREGGEYYVLFGHSNKSNAKSKSYAEPTDHNKDTTLHSFDYNQVVTSDKFGIAPSNTTLSITYRTNSSSNSNAAVGSISTVIEPKLFFDNEEQLDPAKIDYIKENIQVYNEGPINGDITEPTTEEIKIRARANGARQSRCVTLQDYKAAAYSMPAKFGSVKRCAIYIDDNDMRRNLNMYVIAESALRKLEKCSKPLKRNLKTYINTVRMISDSIDIHDTTIINFGVEFDVEAAAHAQTGTLISTCQQALYTFLTTIPPEIGESFSISSVYEILNDLDGVHLVNDVVVTPKFGDRYADYYHDVDTNTTRSRLIRIPHNCIWEIKYLSDITGVIR